MFENCIYAKLFLFPDDTIIILGGVDTESETLFGDVECFDTVNKRLIRDHPFEDIPATLSECGACVVTDF